VRDDIRKYISAVLSEELDCDAAEFQDNTVLGASGLGLESLDLLHLIYSLSDEFHIEMTDDLNPYQAMTLNDLADEVAARVAAAPAG
jgi:acyl carrier protein